MRSHGKGRSFVAVKIGKRWKWQKGVAVRFVCKRFSLLLSNVLQSRVLLAKIGDKDSTLVGGERVDSTAANQTLLLGMLLATFISLG